MSRRLAVPRWLLAVTLLTGLAAAVSGQTTPLIDPSAHPQLVEIPAGPVVMGADPATDPQAFDNERWPASAGDGTVDVARFYLGRSEVTVAQFKVFARETQWRVDALATAAPPDHPVTHVSWPDALAYCRWLESAMRASSGTPAAIRQLLEAGWHLTLPTEAQWEKAARGGDRRVFPWGNEPRRDRANFAGSATTPVGRFPCPECPYGLADMSGNVWEWTRSPYQPYPYDDGDDRANLDADALWVMRGGHFGDPPRLVRASARGAAEPGARRAFIGFRVALTAPLSTSR